MPKAGRWGTALALGLAVLFLGAVDPFPLVVLPWAALLIAFPPRRRAAILLAVPLAILLLGTRGTEGPLGGVTRAWALVLTAGIVAAVAARPGAFLGRGLLAITSALAIVGGWLAATGTWAALDTAARQRIGVIARELIGRLAAGPRGTPWGSDVNVVAEQIANAWWMVYPGLLALQSLAALALAWWAWTRGAQPDERDERANGYVVPLVRLREFRFPDALVWLPIGALALMLLPAGTAAMRVAANVLLFMGGLYALRGVGVFVHLMAGLPPFGLVIGALLAFSLYPFALAAALVVGLGDTWLDLRGRAIKPNA